jgi:uncharacterized glyoxalase superfamily protein PhnB/uncharacterized protein YndB with AHSA1/START domain
MKKAGVTICMQVDVPPAAAFEIFTGEIASWWRPLMRNRFRADRNAVMRFEPGEGGRLIEDANGDVFEVGRIQVWEPGKRLVFDWKLPNFQAGEKSEVEVQFQPKGSGTLVTLEHRGFQDLPKDHPARHGQSDDLVYGRRLASWWDNILGDLQAWVRQHQSPGATSAPYIRAGHSPVTPTLIVSDVAKFLEFAEKGLGGEVVNQLRNLDGSLGHTELRLFGQILTCGQGRAEWKPMPAAFSVYVPDCDAVFQRCVAAGGKVLYEPATHDYGDRSGGIEDPVGNYWWITTHVNE